MVRNIAPRVQVYHGWYVVAACVIVSVVMVGARNSFGAFVIPMSDEFGWSRGTVSLSAFLGFLLNGLTQPLLGRILDRIGGRRVIYVSLIVLGLATLALSLTFNFLFLILVFGVISGTAYSGVSPANTGALLAKWFRRRRATALGVNAAGAALGGLLLFPLTILMIEVVGWRFAWAALGLIVLLVAAPMVYFIVFDHPAKLGLRPDGDSEGQNQGLDHWSMALAGPLDAVRWVCAFRSWPVWQTSAAYLIDGFTTSILLVHFVPYAIGREASASTAAFLLGLMMALSIVGSTGAGMGSDRLDRRTVLTLMYTLRGCGYAVVLLLPGSAGLWLFAAMIGFTWNAPASLTTSLLADIYGLRVLGTISGFAYSSRQIGAAIGVLLTGYLFDLTGSYTLSFAITGFLLLPAVAAVFTIKERKYSARYQLESTDKIKGPQTRSEA